MVIGQCVQDEHEMKLVDCFGKFMTVTLKATGGVDIQQDDIVGKSEKSTKIGFRKSKVLIVLTSNSSRSLPGNL